MTGQQLLDKLRRLKPSDLELVVVLEGWDDYGACGSVKVTRLSMPWYPQGKIILLERAKPDR